MTVYMDLVAGINILVDYLLLLGTNRLCGYSGNWRKAALASCLGGIYAGFCTLPRFHFLGNMLWRLVVLGLMSWIAFGFSKSALRRCLVFVLLSMALGGAAMGIGGGNIWSLTVAGLLIGLICIFGFRNQIGGATYLPVELTYDNKKIRFTALQDTGNTLRDPVTGSSVLVIEGPVAKKLTGFTDQQLRNPVEVMNHPPLPGLRLIPYRTVGRPCGMLLALRIQDVKIGSDKGSSLVAFAPDGLSSDGTYQALTGGVL